MANNPTANAEILRKILEQFSTKELVNLSLVNKLLNYEARSVMRKRGNLSANLGSVEDHPCQRLKAFASVLENMRVIPFAGIDINMHHDYDCKPICNGSLDASCKTILDRLPWKHLSVKFCYDWNACRDCPALLVVKKILEDNCGVLQVLDLFLGKEEFLRTAFQDRSLPCLKILKVDCWDSSTADGRVTSAFIKALVSRAPNLRELHAEGALDYMENILKGSSAVLVLPGLLQPLHGSICESLISSIRIDGMKILVQNRRVDPGLLNRFIPMLLEASRTRLKTLIMDLLFAVPLMCYGICLENLTTLEIHMNVATMDFVEPHVLALPKGLDFTRLFPKLNQVTIRDGHEYDRDFSSHAVSAFVERGSVVLREALPDRAINIKLLKFYAFRCSQESTVPLFAQIFPDVKTLDMNATSEFSFAGLREHFQCLEEVTESYKQFYF